MNRQDLARDQHGIERAIADAEAQRCYASELAGRCKQRERPAGLKGCRPGNKGQACWQGRPVSGRRD